MPCMSRGSPSPGHDETILLAIQFQGLEITVRGPSSQALEFVQQIAPGDHQPPASSAVPDPLPPCPDNLLALSSRLSAASILPPLDRIKRAWNLGCVAKRQWDNIPCPDFVATTIDLPSNYFVLLRGHNVTEPKIIRRAREFNRVLEGAELPGLGQAFPSETEARVYLAAAGRSARSDR